jgi:Cu+-exporting ATPase
MSQVNTANRQTEQEQRSCYHCGDFCPDDTITADNHLFCCQGCKTVYGMLNSSDMCNYYAYNEQSGIKPEDDLLPHRFAYLDDSEIQTKLIHYQSPDLNIVTFSIPQMHCSSCVYLLEKLYRLASGVLHSEVNFVRKTVTLRYHPEQLSLRQLVELLSRIGYEPHISLADMEQKKQHRAQRQLFIKIALAGFAFGNVMMLSFPDYVARYSPVSPEFASFFGYLSILLSLPVLLYAGNDYFVSAYTGLRQRHINIDVPIALGMLVLFGRSAYEIISGTGAGYLDSFNGFVFFLLVGKLFQQKTYAGLAFERDYKSYFPLAVTISEEKGERVIPLARLAVGMRIIVRNRELIPADAVLLNGDAAIDYSFVTGEAEPQSRQSGDVVFAGGRQLGARLELEVIKEVSQSYLTQLWHSAGQERKSPITIAVDRISAGFTIAVLAFAAAAGLYWGIISDIGTSINIMTAVLIVACPCALALSYPFTMGNAMRLMGRSQFFLKDAAVVERLARIKTIIFDKTGTLTYARRAEIRFIGKLEADEIAVLKTVTAASVHPVNLQIQQFLDTAFPSIQAQTVGEFNEYSGKGLRAQCGKRTVLLGHRHWLGQQLGHKSLQESPATAVHFAIGSDYIGFFSIRQQLRDHLAGMIKALQKNYQCAVISGDNDRDRAELRSLFGPETELHFDMSPMAKEAFVTKQKQSANETLMIGDGLNDAGALRAGDVGVSVAEASGQFTPASDAIIRADSLNMLARLLRFANDSLRIVRSSFVFSFLYNSIGLYFAISGALSPLIAAILMPLSSISVITYATVNTWLAARHRGILE